MAADPNAKRFPDTSCDLARRFPLVCLRDDAHLAEVQAVLDGLLQRELDRGAEEYLDVLAALVEAYEDAHEPISDASEADVLRELMRAGGLSQSKLAAATGIAQSTLSAVLSGGPRTLTKEQIVALAKHFGVSPAAFLPA